MLLQGGIDFSFLKMLHVYVCTFSALTVTSKLPISNAHMCVFSTFFVSSNAPFSEAFMAKVTRVCCLLSLVFLETDLPLHFGIRGHSFSQGMVPW